MAEFRVRVHESHYLPDHLRPRVDRRQQISLADHELKPPPIASALTNAV